MERYAKLTVSEKAEKAIKDGGVWIYGAEIRERDPNAVNGRPVDVYSGRGRYLCTGFYNDRSRIAVRVLTTNANDRIDEAFFSRRIGYALSYRKTVLCGDLSSARLIFGDADGFPGFIVDKFADVLVLQIMCLGIELLKDALIPCLIAQLREMGEPVRAVYLRGDAHVREKEGLPRESGYYTCETLPEPESPDDGTVLITENGIRYRVDFRAGQKTGFFLDQKFNRRAAAAIAPGRTVLDCFTHTGAFALNCAAAGAKRVTAVDVSASALEAAKANAALNGFSDIEFLQADVFEYLTALSGAGRSPYDYIILDPPAFTKSSDTVRAAYRGYKEINLKAMRLLPRGGYLSTCSCSHFMTDSLFQRMLLDAAKDANVRVRIAERRQQAADHPILAGADGTEYLKFYILQIV